MRNTTLLITSPQSLVHRPNIDLALKRARTFLNKHRRMFPIPNIQRVQHQGTIDN